MVARFLLLAILGLAGCQSAYAPRSLRESTSPNGPSNDRNWIISQKVLPYAKIGKHDIVVRNIRNFDYITERDVIPRYYDRKFKLDDVRAVDLIVTPFPDTPLLAHTMLSFDLGNGNFLAASAEARLEQGEVYSPLAGAAKQFELMYVLADERDVIRLRTEVRQDDVYIYRTKATPRQAQELLIDVLTRANQLREQPEFYDTISNNCTSNIVEHVNKLKSDTIAFDLRTLLPGLSPGLAYDLGLIEAKGSFEETQLKSNATERAIRWSTAADFSERIRR